MAGGLHPVRPGLRNTSESNFLKDLGPSPEETNGSLQEGCVCPAKRLEPLKKETQILSFTSIVLSKQCAEMRINIKYRNSNGFQQEEMENVSEINLTDEVPELQF